MLCVALILLVFIQSKQVFVCIDKQVLPSRRTRYALCRFSTFVFCFCFLFTYNGHKCEYIVRIDPTMQLPTFVCFFFAQAHAHTFTTLCACMCNDVSTFIVMQTLECEFLIKKKQEENTKTTYKRVYVFFMQHLQKQEKDGKKLFVIFTAFVDAKAIN